MLDQYGQAAEVTLRLVARAEPRDHGAALEELFSCWLFQGALGQVTTASAAAVIAWLAHIVANVASRSLPIVAGATVGGAVRGALAWWSGGVLASLASHILWTGLMLVPTGAGRPAIEGGSAR